jgi:chromosome segregation ATPase
MRKIQEVEKEIERLRDLVAEKKKQKRRIADALSLLESNKADLLGELDDLLSNLTYYYQKHKDLTCTI